MSKEYTSMIPNIVIELHAEQPLSYGALLQRVDSSADKLAFIEQSFDRELRMLRWEGLVDNKPDPRKWHLTPEGNEYATFLLGLSGVEIEGTPPPKTSETE